MRPLARAQEEPAREAGPATAHLDREAPAATPGQDSGADRTSPDLSRPLDPDVSARLEARLIPA